MAGFPNPLNIQLGEGRWYIFPFSDDQGHGVALKYTGIEHTIGAKAADGLHEGTQHSPEENEIYIHCGNITAARVLQDAICKAVLCYVEQEQESEAIYG